MAGLNDGVAFPISATDQFSGAFDKLKARVTEAQSGFSKLNGMLAALGAGLSIGGAAALIKGVVDTMDHLNDLSKTTNVAVEQLAGLAVAAKQSGTDLDTMAGLLEKLSVNMGKNAESFRALGISTKDPLEAFKQLSNLFVGIQDPTQRAAVMAQALGKSWAAAGPLLAEGSTKIAQMVAEGSKLSGITTAMAQQADELNDKWVKLTGAGGLLNQQVGLALPLLNKLADDLIALKSSSSDAGAFATAFAETLRAIVVVAGNVGFVLRGIGTEIGGVAAQVAAFVTGDFARAGEIHRQMVADAADARRKFDEWEVSITKVGTTMKATSAVIDYGDQATRRAASDAAAAGRAFLEAGKAKADAAELEKAFQRMLADANKQYSVAVAEAANGSDRLTSSQKKLLDIVSDPEFKKMGPDMQAEIKNRLAAAAAVEKQQVALARLVELLKEENEERERFNQEWSELMSRGEERIKSLQDEIDATNLEIAVMGKSAVERDVALLQLQRERDLRGVLNEATRAGINLKYDELAAVVKNRGEREKELALWNELGDAAGKFFGDLVEGGKHAFDNLKSWAKQFLEQMVSIFAKRWILQLAASGSSSGSIGSTAASAGENSVANTATNAALNYAGGALGITGSGGFMTGFTAGYAGVGGVEGLGVAGSIGEGLGTFAGGAMDVLAAMGPVGWIALAALAAYMIFGGKGGGPKGGGSFAGNFGDAGQFLGAGSAAGTQNGRLYTPSTDDATVQQLVMGIGSSYADALHSLGGTGPAGLTFGLGYDTDPQGRAPDRVSSVLSDATGNILYQNTNQDTGDSLQGALSLESQRMLLAALQASNLPKEVADILNSLVATAASADDITRVLTAANEMAAVLRALPSLGLNIDVAGLEAMAQSGESIGQTFTRLAQTMASFDDAFMTDAQKLARAQTQVAAGFHDLGVAIPANRTAFYDLVHGLDLTTEAGRAMFTALMALAPAFLITANAADQATAAQDPTALPPGYSISYFDQDSVVTAIKEAADAARQMAESIMSARDNLKDVVNGWFTNPSLSPLSLEDRFVFAQDQYNSVLTGAQHGDLTAIGNLGGTSQSYLELARQLFASSPTYSAIFRDVASQVGGVAGISQGEINARLGASLPKTGQMASSDDIKQLKASVDSLTAMLAGGSLNVSDPAVRQTLELVRTDLQASSGALAGGNGQ